MLSYGRKNCLATLCTGVVLLICIAGTSGQQGNFMGQYAALPWSLAWLNPSYTGFYGGLGNVGQLNSDSSYLAGSGGQIGGVSGQGGYNYAMGMYGSASPLQQTTTTLSLSLSLSLVLLFFHY